MTTSSKAISPSVLISVSDKQGIVDFAKGLAALGFNILSTGGTAQKLKQQGLQVTDVSEYTGFPEIMDGRVKTLHPKIHAAILRRDALDKDILSQHDIQPIDLVVVNLYPFQQTINNPQADFETVIENIDIGGPTLIRAAAKNHQHVTVLVDHHDYDVALQELQENQQIDARKRFYWAKKAFAHTAQYDASIANYLGTLDDAFKPVDYPDTYTAHFINKKQLRYGENPHQTAAFYCEQKPLPGSIASANMLQGKALSYNNIADTDAALECVKDFDDRHACSIIKHANPCGVACADTQKEAYLRAFATDPTSSFGGIIAFNHTLEAPTAQCIIEKQFVEVIIAPDIEQRALEILKRKPNLRVLSCGEWHANPHYRLDYKKVNGGLLVQEYDAIDLNPDNLRTVTQTKPTSEQWEDLLFAWKVVKHVKSNAIVYAKDLATVGIGAGQMSRVYSAKIASIKAQDEGLIITGSVMASDAFFPFRDGIDTAAENGIRAIIQPGGSIRDDEVIKAADEANIAMVFTNIRHFKH